MTSLDRYSPASSAASSTDSSCLPRSRIRLSRTEIAVGAKKFESATDALSAYLRQYEQSNNIDLNGKGQGSSDALLLGSNGLDLGGGSLQSSGNDHKMTLATSKALTGSGLVVGSNGISVAGTKEDVENLLTSQVSPQLQEEVTDALREVKLRRLLKQAAMKSQNQTKTGLQQEVEAALVRSAQLLEKVTREDIPSKKTATAISDISSIPTEVLLNDMSSIDLSDLEEKSSSGHVYSYRTSRPQRSLSQSLSQSLTAPVSYPTHRQPRDRKRRSSIDSLLPPTYHLPRPGNRSSSSSSASLSNQSDPTDILNRIRSRSVSPGLRNRITPPSTPDWVEQLDQSVKKSVPSWVGEMTPSEVSDSVWISEGLLEDRNNRRPPKVPSWVGEAEDANSVDNSNFYNTRPQIPLMSSPAKTNPHRDYQEMDNGVDNTCDITADSRPGLNFSDLATSGLHTPSSNKHVTFTDSVRKQSPPARRKQFSQPKHSSPLPKAQGIRNSGPPSNHPQPSKVLDSEFNGEAFLRNNILPQTARLKKSMDNYVASSENLRRKSTSSNSSDASSGPRCSSLDTLALLTGRPLTRSDITGASPIPKDSIMASKSYSTSPAISGVNSGGQDLSPMSNGHDQDSSDGLDGDRSWERVTSTFKPPVPVDPDGTEHKTYLRNGTSPDKKLEGTLSGGRQPGSMEALKNMLFKLQAEETFTQDIVNKSEETLENSQQNNSQSSMAMIPALQNYDFQQEPGGHSLEKALVHLNRLKKLVKNTATPVASEVGARPRMSPEHSSSNGVTTEAS